MPSSHPRVWIRQYPPSPMTTVASGGETKGPKRLAWTPRNARAQSMIESWPVVVLVNWVFQGLRGCDRKELMTRTLSAAIALSVLRSQLPALRPRLVVVHTLQWLLHGNPFVVLRYTPLFRRSPYAIERFVAQTSRVMRRLKVDCVVIGSLGGQRGATRTSDVDLRFMYPPRLLGWLIGSAILIGLRLSALFSGMPLDVYAYDGVDTLGQFRGDEHVRIISDPAGALRSFYDSRGQRYTLA